MFCVNCGKEIVEGGNFCPACGQPVAVTSLYNEGMFTVTREQAFGGSLVPMKVSVDNGKVYTLPNGQTVQIPMSEGNHKVQITYLHQTSVYDLNFPEQKVFKMRVAGTNAIVEGINAESTNISENTQKAIDFSKSLKSKLQSKATELAGTARTMVKNAVEAQGGDAQEVPSEKKTAEPINEQPKETVLSPDEQLQKTFDELEKSGVVVFDYNKSKIIYIEKTGHLIVRFRGRKLRLPISRIADYKIDREPRHSFLMNRDYYAIYFDMSLRNTDGTLNFIKIPIGDSFNKQQKALMVERGEHIRSYINEIRKTYKERIDEDFVEQMRRQYEGADMENYVSQNLIDRVEDFRNKLADLTDEFNARFDAEESLSDDFDADVYYFLVYLARADGEITAEEGKFISEVVDDEQSLEDLNENYEEAERQGWFDDVPELLTNISPERGFDDSVAQEMYALFDDLGKELMAVDDETSENEIHRFSEYMEKLLNEVERYNHSSDASEETLDSLMSELNNMVGLKAVKEDVNSLINLIQVQRMREERGMKVSPMSLHLVFSGNPGTGKTSVARLLAKIYSKMGLLSTGELVEVDRAGLVGGYVGQTALKVQEVIDKSVGGVLFIDEAYSLVSDRGEGDYGTEAVDTLIKGMEDNRGDLVIIVAGYPDKMEEFLDSNPGLRSRFNKFIHFDDYTSEEMYEIFEKMYTSEEMKITDDAEEMVRAKFNEMCTNKDDTFANGRDVRNYFEKIISNQANRVAKISDPSDEELATITSEDL